MSVLLVFLLFGVLQVAALLYIRSVVGSAASDGARYGANSGVDAVAGAERASTLIGQGLSNSMARQLPCVGSQQQDAATGLAIAQVTCTGKVTSLLLPLGALMTIDISSRSLKEQQP